MSENPVTPAKAAPRKRPATKPVAKSEITPEVLPMTTPSPEEETVPVVVADNSAPKAATSAPEVFPVKAARTVKAPKAAKPPKAPKAQKPAKAEKEEKPVKAEKPAKIKLVRDSFTMPEADYAHLALLKKRCLEAGVAAKKSELLRLGLQVLAQLPSADLAQRIETLEKLKTGRPAKL